MKVYISTGDDFFYGFKVLYDLVILLYFDIFIIMTMLTSLVLMVLIDFVDFDGLMV